MRKLIVLGLLTVACGRNSESQMLQSSKSKVFLGKCSELSSGGVDTQNSGRTELTVDESKREFISVSVIYSNHDCKGKVISKSEGTTATYQIKHNGPLDFSFTELRFDRIGKMQPDYLDELAQIAKIRGSKKIDWLVKFEKEAILFASSNGQNEPALDRFVSFKVK
jgi:hypothetical protein